MQTFMKRAAALLLCLVMLLQFTGCEEGDINASITEIADLATLWSLPSTVKANQTGSHTLAGSAELTYFAVKNEYESCQLMLTAKDAIGAYYLEVSDLTSGSNVLSKDNFTVYMEKFATVSDVTEYGNYTRPDALIPQDAALEHDELQIATGNNGGLWVTVYVPANTPAGTYTGSFKLAVENVSVDIPVSVTVYNYELPETTSGKSLFSWRYNRVGAGELDSSNEMMETYYEFFKNYRISLQSMPLESTTKEEIKAAFDEYYETLTTYTLMPEPGKVPGGGTLAEGTKNMIYYIAQLSGEDGVNYFEKAMLYVVDEPQLWVEESRNSAMSTIDYVNTFLAECVTTIENDSTSAITNFKTTFTNWKNSILNIPNIIPLTETSVEWLVESEGNDATAADAFMQKLNTVCPTFDSAPSLLEWMGDSYPNITNIWWYGCTGPRTPYGNYHIGDDLIRSRTVSWVQAKYGIEGNLYWDAAAYTDENPLYLDQYINVYEYPFRRSDATWPAGDGFLAYPGAAYGVYGPLPSMRLMSIRDGMEELEMLLASGDSSLVESVISESGTSKLVADSKSSSSGISTFNDLRKQLLESVDQERVQKGVTFSLTDTVVEGSDASVSYYAGEGNKVYINDELQTSDGEGNYTYEMDLNESSTLDVEIEAADGTRYQVSRFIAFPTTVLQSFDDASVLEGITVSEGGSAELAQTEGYFTSGSSAHLNVVGKITGNALVDAAYVPTVSIATSVLQEIADLTEVNVLKFDCYNPGEQIKARVKVYSGSTYASVGDITINSGKTTVSLAIGEVQFSAMKDADRIVIEFNNTDDEVTANEYEFYIDNMIAAQ